MTFQAGPVQVGTNGNDILNGTSAGDILFGLQGDDTLDGKEGNDFLFGGDGKDTLTSGSGTDLLVGERGVDTLTGGPDRDFFLFADNPFSGGTPTPAANGIQVLNQPDILKDFQLGEDKLVFKSGELGVNDLRFQKGISSQLAGGDNLLVLQDPFANAAAAAKAIADNNAVTADAGLFVYFNTTLGFSRVVFSQDLSDGGPISVLGNLTNQTNPANQAQFSPQDFVLT
jgi:serralysin